MKKVYLIIILLFFISSSQAQLIRGYGVKIGATISNQKWDYNNYLPELNPESRWGFNVGVFSEFFNSPYLSLITELNYVQKGMKKDLPVSTITNPDGTGEFITWDTRIDYLNLSALGKLRLDFNPLIPYILLGPKIDFQINLDNSMGLLNVVEKNFNEVMYGLKVGIGSEVQFDSFSLLTEILYDYNINELYKNENLTVTLDSFDFRLGIMF
jgi:hypothetical protein